MQLSRYALLGYIGFNFLSFFSFLSPIKFLFIYWYFFVIRRHWLENLWVISVSPDLLHACTTSEIPKLGSVASFRSVRDTTAAAIQVLIFSLEDSSILICILKGAHEVAD